MKRIYTVTASATLILWALSPAQAAPKRSENVSPRQTLEQVDILAGRISARAFELNQMAKRGESAEVQLEGLDHIRDEVNAAGNDLALLQAQKASLPEWEATALDRTLPQLQEVAADTDKAIHFFNTQRDHLWSITYLNDTSDIAKEAHNIATALHESLKFEADPAGSQGR